MKAVLWLAAATAACGQVLSPTAASDLNARVKAHHFDNHARSFLTATPDGLSLVTVEGSNVSLISADPDGRVLYSRSDLASVHAQIYAALPRPDGCVWLLSEGPHGLSQDFAVVSDLGSALPNRHSPGAGSSGARTNYTQMDLYNPAGRHLEALRLLAFVAGSESPIAAADDLLVLRTDNVPGFSSSQTLFHFGTVVDGKFKEQTEVKLVPAVAGGIPLFASDGNFLLVDRHSGNWMVIDRHAKSGRVVPISKPGLVKAAATDSDYVYLLSEDGVLKANSAGQVVSTLHFRFSRAFVPASLAVTGDVLFLADRAGHIERFRLN